MTLATMGGARTHGIPVSAPPPPPSLPHALRRPMTTSADSTRRPPRPEKAPRPPVRAPSLVVERVSPGAFGDDLVAERSPEAFLEAVDAVLARAFPDAGTFGSAGTNGGRGRGTAPPATPRARVAITAARAGRGRFDAVLFADALESCVAGWAPAVAAGVAPPDAARRAALAPKAWDAGPAISARRERCACAAAVDAAAGSRRGPMPPDALAPAPPAVAEKLAIDGPRSLARARRGSG